MKNGSIRALIIVTVMALAGALSGCKKEMTVEDCKAKCVTVGAEQMAKCTMPADACAEAKKKGDESCNKTCELAFPKQ